MKLSISELRRIAPLLTRGQLIRLLNRVES